MSYPWVAVLGLSAALAAGCALPLNPGNGKPRELLVAGPAGQLFVDDGGRGGLPVLFVHSYAGSTAHWQEQLGHLRQSRRAGAMDMRGHGRSDSPRSGGYAVEAMAADIAAVADTLGLRRFVLVGHSMGGAAAAAYAGKYPDRVAGLVLAGAPGKSDPQQARQIMAALQADYDKTVSGYWKSLLAGAQPRVLSALEGDMRRMQREPSMALISALFAFDPLPALQTYTGPKLLIDTPHGDGPTALYRQVPHIPRVVIAGTSHWPHLDKPAEFNLVLGDFLAQLK